MTEQLKLRELRGDDAFTVLELVNTLDLLEPIESILSGEKRKEIIAAFSEESTEADVKEIGFEMIMEISKLAIVRIPKARGDINRFLADMTGSTEEKIQSLPLKQYVGLVKDFFKHPDLEEFFKSLGELMESE